MNSHKKYIIDQTGDFVHRLLSFCRLKKANYRIKRASACGNIKPDFGPSSINLMMADTCNSQCLMCGKDYRSYGTGRFLSIDDIKTIFNHIDLGGVVDVIYGGGGEPFLNKDLAKIAEFTHSISPVLQHTVISNFMEWQQDTVERLLDSRVHFLLSVNAASKKTFKDISGVNAFEKVLKNIRRLVQKREERRSKVKIAMSIVLLRHNVGELREFVTLAASLGVDEVKALYARIYPEKYRIKRDRRNLIAPEDSVFYDQENSDRLIKQSELLAKRLGIHFWHEPLFECDRSQKRYCDEPWKSLFVNFNGDVYPCPASEILFKPKVDSSQYNSGNILKLPIEKIWNNPFWQALRKTNCKRGRREIIPECLCCGNGINWYGPGLKSVHVMNWKLPERSNFRI